MRKTIVLGAVLGGATLAAAGVALGSRADTAATAKKTDLGALLSAAQERPKPKGGARAAGTFTATATPTASGARIAWRLTFSRLTGKAVAAHIHLGKAGKPGPVAISLCGPCRSGQKGTAVATAAQWKAIQAGGTYVNVHTPRNAGGEIRGQLGFRVVTAMSARKETPAPKGDDRGRGTFTLVAVPTRKGASLDWELTFSRLTGKAVAAHVHLGKPGTPGPVAISLCGPCRSGMTGSGVATKAQWKAIRAGGTYVNVHTPTNPGGEIRGQLEPRIATVVARATAPTPPPPPAKTTTDDSGGGGYGIGGGYGY